jgi:hypothetical protein
MELGAEITQLTVGGVTVVALIIGLTQIIREALNIPGRFVGLVPVAAGTVLMVAYTYAPNYTTPVVLGLGVGVSAAMAVRMTKPREE